VALLRPLQQRMQSSFVENWFRERFVLSCASGLGMALLTPIYRTAVLLVEIEATVMAAKSLRRCGILEPGDALEATAMTLSYAASIFAPQN
jgi:hypothetical protein